MLTQAQNDRLTKVGPGTPGGALLRRYWQPLCPAGEITAEHPKKRIRILGEDLLVYRDGAGDLICIEEHCAHRRASLYFGFIEPDGIRCCYHGWKYDKDGHCVERPFEPREATNKICLKAYPLQQLGGVVFVYMGPKPAPLLPRWDVLVRNDGHRAVVVLPTHECNWLQIQENAADTVHTYYVHGHNSAVRNLPTLPISGYYYRPILSYDWSTSEWGIERTVHYGGDHPELEIRPPLIFPNIVRIPEGPIEALHFRVPIDDQRTRIFWVGLRPAKTDTATESFQYTESLPLTYTDEDLATFYGQDRVVCETQGGILDRTKEVLGATDRGIGMFRRMLFEQIDRVERGEAPNVGVVRDEEQNKKMITFVSASRSYTDDEKHVFAAAN